MTQTAQNAPDGAPAGPHPAFERLRRAPVPSLNLEVEEYRHRRTGAMHCHLAAAGPENVFLVAFRTVPEDSRGAAHILEHTALCGSRKYPVRDPFFMMTRRSLNTFMNAFTSSDWTAYPFASKNRKDFDNLLAVYLDAAFFPLLHPLDFAQEGHRLEFAEPGDPDSELLFKGVVYNEMKGAMSSAASALWQALTRHLFPTSTYRHNSGGEPEHIPDLDHGQLLAFYKAHYHPSNALFMTFGDIPAREHQRRFEELALSRFERLDAGIHVPPEKRYLSPIRVEESYAEEETENRDHVVVGWLLGDSTRPSDLFRARLLETLLLDHSASPLMQALETSELGGAPSPLCGMDGSARDIIFAAGLEGCAAGSARQVEGLVLDTLRRVAGSGIEPDQAAAALHQLEMSQREITGGGLPYGLQLLEGVLAATLHGAEPARLLDIDPHLKELKERIADPDFAPRLVRELLLDNPHRLTLTLAPDAELARRRTEAEKARLAAIRRRLDEKETERIVRQADELARRQQRRDDPETLPKVGLEDVPGSIAEPERRDSALPASGRTASCFAQGTNGLCYQHVVMELPRLEPELLEALPLYTACVPELGIGRMSYAEAQNWQSAVSGGVSCFAGLSGATDDAQRVTGHLSFASKSLAANHAAMTELLERTVADARFDEERRVADLIEQLCAHRENGVTAHGHSLAMRLAASRMSPAAWLTHASEGLEGLRRLKALRGRLRDPKQRGALLERFAALHRLAAAAPARHLLVGEAEALPSMLEDVDRRWPTPDGAPPPAFAPPPLRERAAQAWSTATQVNFCAKAFPTVPWDHPDHAALLVLAGLVRNGFLHRAVREQGGAYGAGAVQDAGSASFRFFSYRDPRLKETLDDFDRAVEWALEEDHPPARLEEAVLGVIAAMDKSSSPAGEATRAFYGHLSGRGLERRMELRRRVLAASVEDLRAAAGRYFDPAAASVGVVGGPEALDGLDLPELEIVKL